MSCMIERDFARVPNAATGLISGPFRQTDRGTSLEFEVTVKSVARHLALLAVLFAQTAAAEDIFATRPAFSRAEQPAAASAHCDQIRTMSEGIGEPDFRIDLSLDGKLTALQSDGALWYLVVCNLPDLRVMCVTYESNDMKPGDRVVVKGAYRRIDPNHAVLDPCLASALGGEDQAK